MKIVIINAEIYLVLDKHFEKLEDLKLKLISSLNDREHMDNYNKLNQYIEKNKKSFKYIGISNLEISL